MSTAENREHPQLASIIINNHNYGRFLREAIDSALNQTYQNTEVIVVDDGSTDGSREVIASYGDRIVPVLKQNGGQNSALNAGFSVSRGDVVFFLDADDALLPKAAEAVMRAFCNPDIAKIHWPLVELDDSSRETGRVWDTDHRGPCAPKQGASCERSKREGSTVCQAVPECDMRDRLVREGPDAVPYPPTSGNAFARKFLNSIFPLPDVRRNFDLDPSDREMLWTARPGPEVYLSSLAAVYGRIMRLPEPHGFYRVHGENGYSSLKFEDRLRFDLALFEHTSKATVEYCNKLQIKVDPELWKSRSWAHRICRATEEIAALVPRGATFILVDEDAWGTDPVLAGRKRIPFLEHNGQYWGNPRDDATAIQEVERLRKAGASFMVFAWSTFWWFDCYSGFYEYLRTRFPRIQENERIVVFNIGNEAQPPTD